MIENPLIIFDLGNVLVRHDNELLSRLLAAQCRDRASAKEMLPIYLRSHDDLSTGKSTLNSLYQAYVSEAGFGGTYEEFADSWCGHFSRDPEMEALLETLAARYRVVVLSNTNHAHWDFILRDYPVMQTPHALYASHLLGLAKPDAAIYEAVLKSENRKAEEAIFIDDVAANVEGARAVGINGILFRGAEDLKRDLEQYGIYIKNM
jgi:putative hydrolase of the HAD superfamily